MKSQKLAKSVLGDVSMDGLVNERKCDAAVATGKILDGNRVNK